VNNDFGYLPYRQVSNGKVTSDKSLARVDVFPAARVAMSRLSFLTVNSTASYRTTYYSRSADAHGVVVVRTAHPGIHVAAHRRGRSGLRQDLGHP
jgi:hypothetical protein